MVIVKEREFQLSLRRVLIVVGRVLIVVDHPVHLAREFHKYYQCTIGEYLRKLRIDFACHEVISSDSTLAEIALDAGFFDQSHFSRTFKCHTGLTPTEFRETFRSR